MGALVSLGVIPHEAMFHRGGLTGKVELRQPRAIVKLYRHAESHLNPSHSVQ
jgi:hypothetical protein